MIAGRTRLWPYTVRQVKRRQLQAQLHWLRISSMDPNTNYSVGRQYRSARFESLMVGVSEIRQGQTQLADGTKQLGMV
jgi:hypothetical protein